MAANFAKLEKTMQVRLCAKIRAMGEMWVLVLGARDTRAGQRRGTIGSGTRWLPVLGPWGRTEEEQRMFKLPEQSR